MADSLAQLKTKRGVCRRKITILLKNFEDSNNLPDCTSGAVIVMELKKQLESLEQFNAEILAEDDTNFEDDFSAEMATRTDVTKWEIHYKLRDTQGQGQGIHAQGSVVVVEDPPLKKLHNIQRYGGDPMKYDEFWDSFFHSVHKSTKISNCQKFTYLRSVLEGEALESVRGWPITDDNYDKAISHLKSRFGDRELRKQALWATLIAVEMPGNQSAPDFCALRKFLDTIRVSTRCLESLGVSSDSYAAMLKIIVRQKIPKALDQQWLEIEDPRSSLEDLLVFLERKCSSYERSNVLPRMAQLSMEQSQQTVMTTSTTGGTQNQKQQQQPTPPSPRKLKCQFCPEAHGSWSCPLSKEEKRAAVRTRKLCFNCLRGGHLASDCQSQENCKQCGQRHHTLLHVDRNPSGGQNQQSNSIQTEEGSASSAPSSQDTPGSGNATTATCIIKVSEISTSPPSLSTTLTESPQPPEVVHAELSCKCAGGTRAAIVPIVAVQVSASRGRATARALLDSGSSASFISAAFLDDHGLRAEASSSPISLQLSTFAATEPKTISTRVIRLSLISSDDNQDITHDFIVLESLGVNQDPPRAASLPVRELRMLHGVELSDSPDGTRSDVVMLIGSDLLSRVTTSERIDISNGAMAVKTIFGWSLQGPLHASAPNPASLTSLAISSSSVDTTSLENKVTAFWELEQVPSLPPRIEMDLSNFSSLIQFDGTRYEVPLLWKDPESRPTPNRRMAQTQYEHHKQRAISGQYWNDFHNVLQEYRDFGAIEVDPDQLSGDGYFLPTHSVNQPNHPTHPRRVVMNASAKPRPKSRRQVDQTLSLNDCLNTGPNLLPHVATMTTRFRCKPHPVTGDVKKAFFNISVVERDRKYLRLIAESPERMCRVPFGVSCAPFLLQGTILHHLRECLTGGDIDLHQYTQMYASFYMDDIVSTFATIEQRDQFVIDTIQVLSKAGMETHKWMTLITDENAPSSITSVLGVYWDRLHDTLFFKPPCVSGRANTKRLFLTVLASVFDPLGLVAPLVLEGKIILQKIWSRRLDWDQELSQDIQGRVDEWIHSIEQMDSVHFPRFIAPMSEEYNLHIFSDSSECGLAAVAYAVSKSSSQLICARTRVAPLRAVSLPRLELTAAVLGTELMEFLNQTLDPRPQRTYLWSDSKITLAWIGANSRDYHTFVANRIGIIQGRMTPETSWNFVPGDQNPSDLASRGTVSLPKLQNSMWLMGPEWLIEPSRWPQTDTLDSTTMHEERRTVVNVAVDGTKFDPFPRLQKWDTMVRVLAWTLRLSKKKRDRPTGSLSYSETCNAERKLISLIQFQCFGSEVESLRKRKQISKESRLFSLDPFIDEKGIIRTGGRIKRAVLPYNMRHPIILPYDHRYVGSLVHRAHVSLIHAGTQSMLGILRHKFWIIKGPRLCREIRSKCTVCKRHRPMPVFDPKDAQLPADRVNLTRPFAACGVDYAGPLRVRAEDDPADVSDIHILLFVCASTRAVAYFVVDTLNTEEFIYTFRKFCSRFSTPQLIRSDNAKTFMKAAKLLTVEWRFNPPKAPWWGGFYERFVQLLKKPLRKVLQRSLVTKKELEVVVSEIERSVNQRPLTKPSIDVDDLPAVTPASLMGQNFDDSQYAIGLSAEECTRRQMFLHNLCNLIQKQWRELYVTQLQQIAHHRKTGPGLHVGDIVLVQSDNPRSKWPMARIIDVVKGSDDIVRMVRLTNADGYEFYRPVQHLLPLELHLDMSDNDDVVEAELAEDNNENDEMRQLGRSRAGRLVRPRDRLDL